jgi:hypothetical protein
MPTTINRTYDKNMVLTKMNIEMDLVPDDELDNIIYYLICAKDKQNYEQEAFELRLWSAQNKLNDFIEIIEKDKN